MAKNKKQKTFLPPVTEQSSGLRQIPDQPL